VSQKRTYLGDSLEQLLPQIREELGHDAIVVRQREGIVGGVGGFFGKRCVEVEAEANPSSSARVLSMPRRAVIDAYDMGGGRGAEPGPEGEWPMPSRVFETLLEQAGHFARADEAEPEAEWDCEWDWQAAPALPPEPELEPASAPALEAAPAPEPVTVAVVEPEPVAVVEPEPEPEPEPELLPVLVVEPEPLVELEPAVPALPAVSVQTLLEQLGPIENDDFAAIRTEMLAAALPVRLVGEILADVEQHLVPFEPGASRRSLTRRMLAGRIKTANGWRTKQRTVAVVGFAGSGRTLTTASLAAAYAAAGKSVAALSLEPARDAMRLGELLAERKDIEFEIVDAPARVRAARKRLAGAADVVVADTPPAEGETLRSTLSLLRALEPDETHLVMPSGMTSTEGQAVINTLSEHKLPTRIVITHADDQRPSGAAVGLAVAHRIPVSFLGQGGRLGRLQPADPEALARMVLR
jgi:flagellar biosynthesis protein FlhF